MKRKSSNHLIEFGKAASKLDKLSRRTGISCCVIHCPLHTSLSKMTRTMQALFHFRQRPVSLGKNLTTSDLASFKKKMKIAIKKAVLNMEASFVLEMNEQRKRKKYSKNNSFGRHGISSTIESPAPGSVPNPRRKARRVEGRRIINREKSDLNGGCCTTGWSCTNSYLCFRFGKAKSRRYGRSLIANKHAAWCISTRAKVFLIATSI